MVAGLQNTLEEQKVGTKRQPDAFQKEQLFCSGQIPLWSEGGTVGVAGIITGIMR